MKQLILSFAAMLALALPSFAQTPASPSATAATPADVPAAKAEMPKKGKGGHDMGKHADHKGGPLKDLGLSTDQETAFKAANQAHQAKVAAILKDKTIAADAKKTQIDALKGEYDTAVKNVLTPEQYTKWAEKRADRAEKKMEKRAERMEKRAERAEGEMKHDGEHKMHEGKGKMKKMKDAAQEAVPAVKPN
jgi:periplasmic protein CpxP/Spy